MKYIKRFLERNILEAANSFPVILLTGPRQVGKTTSLNHIKGKERQYISLDDPVIRALVEEEPELFLQRYPPPVVIDEIQYAPSLLPYIKLSVDQSRKNNQFWLTGSQHFVLMRGITESLAGRVAVIQMSGLSQNEKWGSKLEKRFIPGKTIRSHSSKHSLHDLYKLIWQGSFPALYSGKSSNWHLYYSSYMQTYIQRDIRDLTQVADINQFTRFVRICASRTAQILNMSDISEECGTSVNTVKKWLSILETSGLIHLLKPYHSNPGKRLIKSPKLYFLDTGLASWLCGWSSYQTLMDGAQAGNMFETYIISELMKTWSNSLYAPPFYYYRDREKNEIDLVINIDGRDHPVEIKKSAKPSPDWIKHFDKIHDPGPGTVIATVGKTLPLNKMNDAVPWDCL